MNWKVPLSDLDFGVEEKEAVLKVLDKGWLTMGEITQQFEQEFARQVRVKHAIAVTNGTASLHLACRALGIGPGDEVIVPSLTFVATANAVLYVGAKPVFADVQGDNNLTISVDSIEALITDRTKAIMVMHYGGFPCDMPAITEIARKHHLAVIEDAAHSPGASIQDIPMGGWGDIASFSFFPNKNMTTAEGGMLTTNNDQLAEKIRILRSHGMTTLTWDRHQGHAWSYDVVDLGYNYRIDEIRSTIGIEQLKKLNKNNSQRKALSQLYEQLLQQAVPEVAIPFKDFPWQSAYHILPILLPPGVDRALFIQSMKDQQIQTSLHYPPIHLFRYYKENKLSPSYPLPVTESIAKREVTLPLFSNLRPEQVEIVVDAVKTALHHAVNRENSVPLTTS